MINQKTNKMRFVWIFCVILTFLYAMFLFFAYKPLASPDATETDLPAHIKAGIEDKSVYSLTYIILGLLWRLPHGSCFIALFLALFLCLSVLFTFILLKKLVGNIQNHWLYIISLALNIYMPLYVPIINKDMYLGTISFNLYHNPTYITMKPFAILSLFLFIQIREKILDKELDVFKYILFALALFIATWFKPSFAFGFIPCVVLAVLVDFFRGKLKNINKFIFLGFTFVPTALLMLWQRTQLFNDDGVSEISIGIFKVWSLYVRHPLAALVLSLAFPIVVLIFNFKDLAKDKVYRFSWIFAVFNVLIFAFLYESGPRMAHGNFGWGAHFAVGVLFILSIAKFIQKIKKINIEKTVFGSLVLGMHLIAGLNYFLQFCFSKFWF